MGVTAAPLAGRGVVGHDSILTGSHGVAFVAAWGAPRADIHEDIGSQADVTAWAIVAPIAGHGGLGCGCPNARCACPYGSFGSSSSCIARKNAFVLISYVNGVNYLCRALSIIFFCYAYTHIYISCYTKKGESISGQTHQNLSFVNLELRLISQIV